MEKEDEGAAEEDIEDDEVDVKGEPGAPMDIFIARAQEHMSQPTQQMDRMHGIEMLSDVTDLSSSPMPL